VLIIVDLESIAFEKFISADEVLDVQLARVDNLQHMVYDHIFE
jgi:hypothetical protein